MQSEGRYLRLDRNIVRVMQVQNYPQPRIRLTPCNYRTITLISDLKIDDVIASADLVVPLTIDPLDQINPVRLYTRNT